MTNTSRIIGRGKRVLELERDVLADAAVRLDDAFASAVQLIQQAKGRVIVAGIGKSGLIARKIAATMTSTGTPAYFLHPTESVHGDLGIVTDDDVAILISKSGETQELLPLLAGHGDWQTANWINNRKQRNGDFKKGCPIGHKSLNVCEYAYSKLKYAG